MAVGRAEHEIRDRVGAAVVAQQALAEQDGDADVSGVSKQRIEAAAFQARRVLDPSAHGRRQPGQRVGALAIKRFEKGPFRRGDFLRGRRPRELGVRGIDGQTCGAETPIGFPALLNQRQCGHAGEVPAGDLEALARAHDLGRIGAVVLRESSVDEWLAHGVRKAEIERLSRKKDLGHVRGRDALLVDLEEIVGGTPEGLCRPTPS